MQCVNCQFENMPGLTNCVRCGSTLTLATAMIDVYPPRQSQWSKRFGLRRVRRARKSVGDRIESRLRTGLRKFVQEIGIEVPLIAALVPGLPQFRVGRNLLGWIFSLGYFALLIPALIFLGSDLSTGLLGAALSFHLSSVLDIVWRSPKGDGMQLHEAAVMLGFVSVFAYLPAIYLLFVFCWPMQILQPVAGFQTGDTVLVRRASTVHVGDVVRYRPPNEIPGYRLRGTWIERVLADEGSKVVWDGKQVIVDGQPSKWRPLSHMTVSPGTSWTVPKDSVLIRPSAGIQIRDDHRLYIVPRSQIVGRLFWRTWPTAKWGSLP